MSNPVIRAFFMGRAVAEVLNEKIEDAWTNALADFGKFEAEQRENLREFTQAVMDRAEREMAKAQVGSPGAGVSEHGSGSTDLQETLDELRAEVARLRSALNNI